MCELQFETETWKGKTHTKSLDTHTTKTKRIFSQGLQGAHLPPTLPFYGRRGGNLRREGGREGGKEEEGKAEPVREEAALGLTAWGLSPSPKPALLCKVF